MRPGSRVSLLLAGATLAIAACTHGALSLGGGVSPSVTATPTPVSSVPPSAYQRTLTIPHSQVGEAGTLALSGFPLLVYVLDTSLRTQANGGHVHDPQGRDLTVRADGPANCGSLPVCALSSQILFYDGTSGEAYLEARVPALAGTGASADTVLSLGYGGLPTPHIAADVWDADYRGVWLMAEGAGTTAADSTANSQDAMLSSITWAAGGLISPAAPVFDGATSQAVLPNSAKLTVSDALTLEGWVNPASNNGQAYLCWHGKALGSGPQLDYFLSVQGGPLQQIQFQAGQANLNGNLAANAALGWHRVAATWNGVTSTVFLDSAQVGTQPGSGVIVSQGSAGGLGYTGGTGRQFDLTGMLQDVRVSDIARDPAWLFTTYTNQRYPQSFVVLGPETSGSAGLPGAAAPPSR